ncbi:MAG: energy transducer TonB [Alphaproteobacteria bacterium]
MERPSHIEMLAHQSPLQRLPILALAISLQVAIAWLFTQGLVSHVITVGGYIIELTPLKPVDEKRAIPPPAPQMPKLKPVTAQLPIFTTRTEPGDKAITATLPPSNTGGSGTAAGVDRAPVSITATHTTPPYPAAARRAGMEGNVTLRLTVLADGHVGAAQVAVSSGHALLDEAAQAWIVGHWIYKPALKDGAPVASQTTALVTFALENGR